jgi:hypothetical protein
MKMAKASTEDVAAMESFVRCWMALERRNFPPRPDGTWADDDPDHDMLTWEAEDYQRAMERLLDCFADHPGAFMRCFGGFHLAMTNDVFDPNADTYDWHPSLVAAVEARNSQKQEVPS